MSTIKYELLYCRNPSLKLEEKKPSEGSKLQQLIIAIQSFTDEHTCDLDMVDASDEWGMDEVHGYVNSLMDDLRDIVKEFEEE
jgi:hypothetical protein